MRDGLPLSGLVLPPPSRHSAPVHADGKSARSSFDGVLIPARIALPSLWGANRPGKAFGGSFEAPLGTLLLFAEIVKHDARDRASLAYDAAKRAARLPGRGMRRRWGRS